MLVIDEIYIYRFRVEARDAKSIARNGRKQAVDVPFLDVGMQRRREPSFYWNKLVRRLIVRTKPQPT